MRNTISEDRPVLPELDAPRAWRNWRALTNVGRRYINEYPLYSDAWFTAEARDRGPYSVLNALPRTTHSGGMHEWKPALVLRASHHLPSEHRDMSVTAKKHYHGGWLAD